MPYNHDHKIKAQIDRGESMSTVLAGCRASELLEVFCQHPETFAMISGRNAAALQAKLRSMGGEGRKPWDSLFPESSWQVKPQWNFKTAINATTADVLSIIRPELALHLARDHYHNVDHHDAQIVAKLFGGDAPAHAVSSLDKFSRLWVALRRLSGDKGWDERSKTARAAVESYIMRLVEDSPVLWADSLHLILPLAPEIGEFVDIVTVTMAQRSPEVVSSLQFIAEHSESISLRDYARGLLLAAESMDEPKSATVSRMIDMLARWAGRGVLFPHPLSPSSKIWLASHDAEAELQLGLRSGLQQFQEHFRSQGAEDERGLVGRLLTELAVPFRARSPVTRALGRLGLGIKPRIGLEHRPLTATEEKAHGPDIAFIVRANVHGSMAMEFAEFVQVKKPKQYGGRWKESWTIDVEQLNNLLNTSASSAYWLIDWEGRVCAVPAKYIRAWMPKKAGDTFTLGFNSIRSAAIPADQFLSELCLGAWVGSSHPTAMKIARGEFSGLVPRNLVEVNVLLHGDQ